MNSNHDWNYRITQFFLNNSRTTFLTLVVLLLLGGLSTLSLKTTGFPSPDVGILLVSSQYPGASTDSVLKDVTKPIEIVIKGIEDVESYSSTTNSGFSIVSATLKPNVKKTDVQNKVNAGISTISLPDNVVTSVSSPNVGGSDFIFSMYNKDNSFLHRDFLKVKSIFEKNAKTKSVKAENELLEQVVIKIDKSELLQKGIDVSTIQQAIKSLGEAIPISNNFDNKDQKTSIVASIKDGQNLEALKNLEIQSGLKLKDLSDISLQYNYKNAILNQIAIKEDDKSYIGNALVFNVNLNEKVDASKYFNDIKKEIDEIDTVSLDHIKNDKTNLITSYSVATDNSEQVNEVLSGLVGGPLNINNKTLAQVGWLLGGIQLVMLVMIAFVSWRAAIIAAISIPLSLIFTNIYLYFTGESLNTLVLFSFVLVIGLVVDPALVILESIQRKIDAGLKGNKAALSAVKDVGGGLFMATLTNIIVFAPFGLISGILGQIFAYIPLTIVPATIGSYVVPLVFLTWLSGKMLKKSKNSISTFDKNATPEEVEKAIHKNEIANMWGVAKWLVNLNKAILNSSWIIRVAIIVVTLGLSLLISSIYFGNNLIKSVQFSEASNPPSLLLNIVHKTSATDSQKNELNTSILSKINSYNDVKAISPFQNLIRIELVEAKDRVGTSVDLAKKISNELRTQFLPQLFDISINPLSNGPSGSSYQVLMAVEDENSENLKKSALAVSSILNKICEDKGIVEIKSDCNGTKINIVRVDDGYTGKENEVEYLEFDRAELTKNNLILQGNSQAPSIIYTASNIRSLFSIDDNKSQNTLNIEGREVPIILQNKNGLPKTLDEILNSKLFNFDRPVPKEILIKDIAKVVKKSPPSSITRSKGKTTGQVKIGLEEGKKDQQTASKVTSAITKYFDNDEKSKELGIKKGSIKAFSEGGTSGFAKSFNELILSLLFAIIATYFVLALFFKSLSMPFAILYTIPLTLVGVLPALTHIGNAQFGFLEIIGLIILIGIVENVAIFLIDSANHMIVDEGLSDKEAIAISSGLRLRPVILTKLTAIASLAPLAWLSETYRPISLVIIFGLLASGFVSLITTPILYIAFRRMSSFIRGLFVSKKHK